MPRAPKPVGMNCINEDTTKSNKQSIILNPKEGKIICIKNAFAQYINQIKIEEKITIPLPDE